MNTQKPSNCILVLGGARSGKSRYAETQLAAFPPPWTYIATAQGLDDEMRDRIQEHRARRDSRWQTVNAPLDLPEAIANADSTRQPVLVDCLTLWLSNILLSECDLSDASARLITRLKCIQTPVVIVSNEVGLGIVPGTPLGRQFRDAQGRLNQQVAEIADRVIFMAAGLPMQFK